VWELIACQSKAKRNAFSRMALTSWGGCEEDWPRAVVPGTGREGAPVAFHTHKTQKRPHQGLGVVAPGLRVQVWAAGQIADRVVGRAASPLAARCAHAVLAGHDLNIIYYITLF
jgi:hypothetical protein